MQEDTIRKNHTDIFIIGGGINGAGIAADASSKGLNVILCEKGDLASGTSSKSTKLIHGGLRYLEHFEFKLVRESLKEREVLLNKAPHIITPTQFIMPHNQDLRPAWMIKLGLFLYDHLAKRKKIPGSKSIQLNQHDAGHIIQDHIKKGFIYSDCRVDDARLVILNALAAEENGAQILTRTEIVSTQRNSKTWDITIKDKHTNEIKHISAKALINAAGPWALDVINTQLKITPKHQLVLVKGSHIIVPKLYDEDFSFILPNTDKRIVFAIPYLERYTLIGTTDIPIEGKPDNAHISQQEIEYLCNAVNLYFKQSISLKDVISTYSGVRPLLKDEHDNPSAITRGYTLDLDTENHQAPVITIYGGKLTTYRKLAEHTLEILQPFFKDMQDISTAKIPLPGGDIQDIALYKKAFAKRHPFLPPNLANRWISLYGTRADMMVDGVKSIADLGKHIGADLYEKEVKYLINHEWAQTSEDILWRRTKLGFSFTKTMCEILKQEFPNK